MTNKKLGTILFIRMNYNKKDVVIGFVIIALIIVASLIYRKINNPNLKVKDSISPTPISFQKEIENKFNIVIPENTNSIELVDISGGNGRGIATKSEILADIDDPASGYFYEGWLSKDNNFVSLGKLQVAKGGWLLEYNGSNYTDYNNVIVSLEKVFDNKIETKILEGSF